MQKVEGEPKDIYINLIANLPLFVYCNSVPPQTGSKEKEEENLKWLQQSKSLMKQHSEAIKPVIQHVWPDKPSLIDDELFPFQLIQTCMATQTPEVLPLIDKIRDRLEMVKLQLDVGAEFLRTSSEFIEQLTAKGQYFVEFHAKLPEHEYLPRGQTIKVLVIRRNTSEEYIYMRYHRDKDCFCAKTILPEYCKEFEYKYFTTETHWENLGQNMLENRQLKITKEDIASRTIRLFDIVTFAPQEWDYAHLLVSYLPRIRFEQDLEENIDTIYAWVYQMKRGWKRATQRYASILPADRVEKYIVQWATQTLHGRNSKTVVNCVVCCLALSSALLHNRISVAEETLLTNLFEMLRTEDVSREVMKTLYKKILTHFINNDYRSKVYPAIPDAIVALFKTMEFRPVANFLLALPVYWLIITGGEFNEMPRNGATEYLLSHSCLPASEKVNWTHIKRGCQRVDIQGKLRDMVEKIVRIARNQPWIGRAYQYMLTEESLTTLLKDKRQFKVPFTVEYLIGSLLRTFNNVYVTETYLSYMKRYLDEALENMKSVMLYVSEKDFVPGLHTVDVQYTLVSIQHILQRINQHAQKDVDNKLVLFCLNLCVNLQEVSQQMESMRYTSGESSMSSNDLIKSIARVVYERLEKCTVTKEQVEYWNDIVQIEWADELFQENWKSTLTKKFQMAIEKKWLGKDEDFMMYYVQKLIPDVKLCSALEAVFKRRIEKGFEYLLLEGTLQKQDRSYRNFFGWFTTPGASEVKQNLIELYDGFVLKQMMAMTPIAFILDWPHLIDFFKSFYRKDFKGFSDATKFEIRQRIEAYYSHMKDFLSGAIPVEQVHKIISCERRCRELNQMLGKIKHEDFEILITQRKQQLDAFGDTRSCISLFLQACNHLEKEGISVNVGELEAKFSVDETALLLLELVECKDCRGDTKVIFFQDLSPELTEIQAAGILQNNGVFLQLWLNECPDVKQKWTEQMGDKDQKVIVPWRKLVQDLWMPVKKKLLEFASNLFDGTLIMKSFTQILEKVTRDELHGILKSLFDFSEQCSDMNYHNVLEKRTRQIIQFMNLRNSQDLTEVLQYLRVKIGSGRGFQTLDVFQSPRYQDLTLADVERLECPKAISDITAEETCILQGFAEQKDLLTWLWDNTKKIEDIQSLCDLAMISAGEKPEEVYKVSSLLTAVTGFSPLIFNLDEVLNLDKLLTRCKQVLKNCKKDESLLHKWTAIGSQVAWLRHTEKFFGSVEKSSMVQVQEINDRGIYIITQAASSLNPSLHDCLHLKIRAVEEGMESNVMRLSELHDLQSKLMLIAGEREAGKQAANFIHTLAAVESLAGAFIKLVQVGCMLFQQWKADIACGYKNQTPEFTFNVKFHPDAPLISGVGGHDMIDKVTGTMNEILSSWNSHIEKTRLKYYFLNEYNIIQITYLCKQLANQHTATLPDQVYMLLGKVKRNATFGEIRDALDEATRTADKEEDSGEEDVTREEEPSELQKIDKMKKMVRALVYEDDIPEDVAKAAVKENGYGDKVECVEWVLLHYSEDELIQDLCDQFNEDICFGHDESDERVMSSILYDRSSRTLNEVLLSLQGDIGSSSENAISESILTLYTKYNRDTSSLTLQDFVSVKHLGIFLELLGKLKTSDALERELQFPLEKGRPNLMICPEAETISTLLPLYMKNANEPLPKSSEVLLCCSETTCDEVERFFRRALCKCDDIGTPIFCLAFAHNLTHSVSENAENIFNELSHGDINREYQLVILTSRQQHYLTTCFDQYQKDPPMSVSDEEIAKYLAHHLKVNPNVMKKSASVVEECAFMVKVVYSNRSGVGKTLHVTRLKQELSRRMEQQKIVWHTSTIRFMQKQLDAEHFIDALHLDEGGILNSETHLIHIDLTPAVQHGIERFMFNLLVLGSIEDERGRIWQVNRNHLYVIELTDFHNGSLKTGSQKTLKLLPKTRCLSPRDILSQTEEKDHNCLYMDQGELLSQTFQRPLQYLTRHKQNLNLDDFEYDPQSLVLNQNRCIDLLLNYCSIGNPSWAQLKHFVSFLNVQLRNCENSVFCNKELAMELKGLKTFAVRFMIIMAQDFATPSLQIADTSEQDTTDGASDFQIHQLRRKWEETSHPYVFFNDDCETMTFINVSISDDGHLLKEDDVVEKYIIPPEHVDLLDYLKGQGVPIGVNFEELKRTEKLKEICKVMGIQMPDNIVPDPDPTYELTTDNVLKILAIYMRLRCRIPVIIMGETGCGKTRMIEFISKLKKAGVVYCLKHKIKKEVKSEVKYKNILDKIEKEGVSQDVIRMCEDQHINEQLLNLMRTARMSEEMQNIIILKVHGGITVEDVHDSIRRATAVASENLVNFGLSTILFYDEANTTESIYAIKEVLCDLEVNGQSFSESNLQIIAACNPYKTLSKKALQKLENSGLGYKVRREETSLCFGSIPMRTLVYRVVPLPPSMQPFVWDFGQLSREAEQIYIKQMAIKLGSRLGLELVDINIISLILSEAQSYMRSQKDECRYVSLRDVERCITAYEWFYSKKDWLYRKIDASLKQDPKFKTDRVYHIEPNIRTLILALGLCYHSSLDNREDFRNMLSDFLLRSGKRYSEHDILSELIACQKAVVLDMKKEKYVAVNEALMENVYVMSVCIDMRIPLFLVGKPGSSKSLAKTIVSDNMKGDNSTGKVYKRLKHVHVASFQCSALTRADGIKNIFSQCTALQKSQDLTKFVAVVVLDEIGLAEDSPNMPLKILHPLLESGSTAYDDLTNQEPHNKVAFVGISNWALDPAKMNRGIFVTRNKPDPDDMKKTTEAIFSSCDEKLRENQRVINALIDTYLQIYAEQETEYFGLRDFYSLIKMVMMSCRNKGMTGLKLTMQDVMDAVHRNFSGGEISYMDTFRRAIIATQEFQGITHFRSMTIHSVIAESLKSAECRYLLLLTTQYSALNLLYIIEKKGVQVIFGSSFPQDKNYTEICRNINRVKLCMESGCTVIIMNLTEIHESLYDALNQHYVTFGDQKFVDLGLGGHRVKCKVHDDFRMIVVENKDIVYKEYPIPLINRLEKHHFDSQSLLREEQKQASENLGQWVDYFTTFQDPDYTFEKSDAFIGYHGDTVSSIILTCDAKRKDQVRSDDYYQQTILQSATMDSIFRLDKSNMDINVKDIQNTYFKKQAHDSLEQLLLQALKQNQDKIPVFEIVTFSNILSEKDRAELEKKLLLNKNSVMLISLQRFDTQQDYERKLDGFFRKCEKGDSDAILLIQCSQAHNHEQLIACARFNLTNKLNQFLALQGVARGERKQKVVVSFLLSTERKCSKNGHSGKLLVLQHTTDGEIVYIDELRPKQTLIGSPSGFLSLSVSEVFQKALDLGKEEETFLDVSSLLNDCLCEALNKLESNVKGRDVKRIEILTELLRNEAITSLLLHKMVEICKEREGDIQKSFSWIVEEACSVKNLLEAGTFRKCIWLHLKHLAAEILAYITSIIDHDNNLDTIFPLDINTRTWKEQMWKTMFCLKKFSWSEMKNANKFPVATSEALSYYQFQVPFSFFIHSIWSNEWNAVINEFGEKKMEVFLNGIRQQEFMNILRSALRAAGQTVLIAFISDLVRYVYKPRCMEVAKMESEVIDKILNAFITSKLSNFKDADTYQFGDDLPIAYYIILDTRKYLEILADLFGLYPEVLANASKWIEIAGSSDAFRFHELAFHDMINHLKETSMKISDPTVCQEWISFAKSASRVFHSIIDLIEEEHRDKLQQDWESISWLNLLITQLIPESDTGKDYVKVIAKQASLLGKGCRQRELHSKNFIRLLVSALGLCYEDIHLKLLLSWQDLACKVCKKRMNKPFSLSCGHFLCHVCIEIMVEDDSSTCPTCNERLSKEKKAVELTEKGSIELEDFKLNCTSFFLDFLSKFVAKKDMKQNIDEDVLDMLLNELLLPEPSSEPEAKPQLKTHAIDLNVNTRSLILKFLYDRSPLFRQKLVEKLSHGERHCLENLIITILKFQEGGTINTERDLRDFASLLQRTSGDIMDLEFLENVARVRLCISAMVTDFHKSFGKNSEGPDQATIAALHHVNEDTLKLYFIKCGCFLFGMEWFEKLLATEHADHLVPEFLSSAASDGSVDFGRLVGENYIHKRSDLISMSEDHRMRKIDELIAELNSFTTIDEVTDLIVMISYIQAGSKEKEYFINCLRENSEEKPSLQSLVVAVEELLPDFHEITTESQQASLRQVLVMIFIVITHQGFLLEQFLKLLHDPGKIGQMFLPSMPESLYFAVPKEFRTEKKNVLDEYWTDMYTCPNGHIYTIGDCTHPVFHGKCNECGAVIGGQEYKPAPGNKRFVMEEKSQCGYLLEGSVAGRANLDNPEERMSRQGVAVTRLFLHSCMLVSIHCDRDLLSRFSQDPATTFEDFFAFICHQIHKNINDLSEALGRNVDDTLITLYKLLIHMFETKAPEGELEAVNWETIESRRQWEKMFREHYLIPVFKNLDGQIADGWAKINQDGDLCEMMLYRIVHEVPSQLPDSENQNMFDNPSLWRIIKHPSATHLQQTLRDKTDNLSEITQLIMETPNLDFLHYLKPVIDLQTALIDKYQYKLDMASADQMSIHDLLKEEGFNRQKIEGLLGKYILAWRVLDGKAEPISKNSPISMALPSNRGRGKWAKMLTEHLIEIQNRFLVECAQKIQGLSIGEVAVRELTASQVVCINKEMDLLSLIQMHTHYSIEEDENGTLHHISYNLDALEKQVREKFVLYKKMIKKQTVPCIQYPQDIGIGTDWHNLEKLIPQEKLPAKLVMNTDTLVVGVQAADLYEGVRTLTHAISFLTKVPTKANRCLKDYLTKDLLLADGHAVIHKSAEVKHSLGLYQRLTWHKAVKFVLQGLNPYQEVLPEGELENIPDNEIVNVDKVFPEMNVNLLQERLNEILIKKPTHNPEWSLVEELFPFIEDFLDGETDDDSWYRRIPPSIKFKHITHLFQLAVHYSKQNVM